MVSVIGVFKTYQPPVNKPGANITYIEVAHFNRSKFKQ